MLSHAVSPDSDAKKSQSFLCPRAQPSPLMLDPPPSTLPILSGMERPLRGGLGWPTNFQSSSVPSFPPKRAASVTLGTSSLPPASSKITLTSGFSARRRATTDPEEPDPQTMKSYCEARRSLSFRWFPRTRSAKSNGDCFAQFELISLLLCAG